MVMMMVMIMVMVIVMMMMVMKMVMIMTIWRWLCNDDGNHDDDDSYYDHNISTGIPNELRMTVISHVRRFFSLPGLPVPALHCTSGSVLLGSFIP